MFCFPCSPLPKACPAIPASPRHRGHVAVQDARLPCRENLRLAEQVPSRVVVQLHHVAARVAHSLEPAEVAVPGGELREAALSPGGAGRDAGLLLIGRKSSRTRSPRGTPARPRSGAAPVVRAEHRAHRAGLAVQVVLPVRVEDPGIAALRPLGEALLDSTDVVVPVRERNAPRVRLRAQPAQPIPGIEPRPAVGIVHLGLAAQVVVLRGDGVALLVDDADEVSSGIVRSSSR